MNTLTLDPVADFVAENHVHWAKESREKLSAYLLWHQDRGLLSTSAIGEDVYGMCTIRFFVRLEDWLNPWVFEPDGAFCMIDLLVAVSPLAMADCCQQLVDRWGSRPVMIWERGDRTIESTKAPRMFRWDQFSKLAKRITYGVLDL